MPLYIDDFIKLLAEICDQKELKVTLRESVKGGLVAGLTAILGGVLLGPAGLALGGAVGGGAAALSARNKFQPVGLVLLSMSPQQKKRLYDQCLYAFRDFGPQDVMALSALVMSQVSLTDLAVDVVKNFLSKDMSLSIMN